MEMERSNEHRICRPILEAEKGLSSVALASIEFWCQLTGWDKVLNDVDSCLAALEQGLYMFTLAVTVVESAPGSFSKRALEKGTFVLDETEI